MVPDTLYAIIYGLLFSQDNYTQWSGRFICSKFPYIELFLVHAA